MLGLLFTTEAGGRQCVLWNCWWTCTRPHGVTTQKISVFIVTAVRTTDATNMVRKLLWNMCTCELSVQLVTAVTVRLFCIHWALIILNCGSNSFTVYAPPPPTHTHVSSACQSVGDCRVQSVTQWTWHAVDIVHLPEFFRHSVLGTGPVSRAERFSLGRACYWTSDVPYGAPIWVGAPLRLHMMVETAPVSGTLSLNLDGQSPE
jgi:hypothetical protein